MIEYIGVKHLRYLDGLILMRQIDTSSNPRLFVAGANQSCYCGGGDCNIKYTVN